MTVHDDEREDVTLIRVGRLSGSREMARSLCKDVRAGTPVVIEFRDLRSGATSWIEELLTCATVAPDHRNPVTIRNASAQVLAIIEAWLGSTPPQVQPDVTFHHS